MNQIAAPRTKAACRGAYASDNPTTQDHAFIGLLNGYRPYGGLFRQHHPTAGASPGLEGSDCNVQDLFNAGELFGFNWHDALWIPRFQLDVPWPTIATGPQRVAAELSPAYDGWALASWFVQPNAWLASDCAIECMASRLHDVLEAARADRYVASA